jgi:hypothetical protein
VLAGPPRNIQLLKLIALANLIKLEELQPDLKEKDELIAIFVTGIKTAKNNNKK